MKEYYLIPVTDYNIYYNNKSLRDILGDMYPELVNREEERITILYSTSPLREMPLSEKIRYQQHSIETKKLYDDLSVPQYLIACGNDKCAKEILTGMKIISEYPAALGIRSVSKEKALEYYYSSNYKDKITNYFKNAKIISKLPPIEEHNILGYIEGNLDGQPIKGNFSGKIKKLNL